MTKDWRKAIIDGHATARDALAAIERGSLQIALVVDESGRLRGTVTDGDVRRGILRGVKLDDAVDQVMNANPRTVPPNMPRQAVLKVMADLGIHQLPVVDADGHVFGLERIDSLIEIPSVDTWVILMAGGLGTRLKPITETIPKPMIPVGGRPLIENIVNNFVAQGFRRFIFAVNYKAELFREHFGDGQRLGVTIEYLHERERRGTAGALALLHERPTSPILVMNGDLMTTVNFRQLLDFHREHAAAATMCVREYAFQIPYGVIEADRHRLTALVEKPLRTALVNAGIYALSPEAIDVIPAGRMYDMTDLFADLVAAGRNTVVFPVHEYWLDIGRIEDLERASSDYSKVFE
jgi:dTDP-glucose pyrophosphorylase